MLNCSCYHQDNYNPISLKKRVARMSRKLASLEKKLDFDAIAFRGTSGAALAYPLSVVHGYHLICVRKERDTQHHGSKVEASANRSIKKYIIVDDFIADGNTVRAIVRSVNKQSGWLSKGAKCVGVVVFKDYSDEEEVVISKKESIPIFFPPKR